jgi:hypothetical protein
MYHTGTVLTVLNAAIPANYARQARGRAGAFIRDLR